MTTPAQPAMPAPGLPAPGDPLADLAPLRMPETIDWWPLAPGWWVLLGLLVVGSVLLVRWQLRRKYRERYRASAVDALSTLKQQGNVSVAELNRLLKSLALQHFPAQEIASLHGERWVSFLAQHCEQSAQSDLAPLGDVYRADDAAASNNTVKACEIWIQKHRRPNV